MEQFENIQWMDFVLEPVLCIRNDCIAHVNPPAAQLFLREGMALESILLTGWEEYRAFRDGRLYVTLEIGQQRWGATATRSGEDTFLFLDHQFDSPELQALALAAKDLRGPLGDALLAAEKISRCEQPELRDASSCLNRGLYRLLRIIGNMSDAGGRGILFTPERRNLAALFREIFEKAADLAETTGAKLVYEGPSEEIVGIADAQHLERAALNLVSNALKFSDKGSTIHVRLTRQGSQLLLQITNRGSNIPDEVRATLFRRYLRQPAIEDSRYGVGLGLLMVRIAAASHGGAILIDQPEAGTTRVTLSMEIRTEEDPQVRAPLLVDYAGEYSHALVELADCLDAEVYEKA